LGDGDAGLELGDHFDFSQFALRCSCADIRASFRSRRSRDVATGHDAMVRTSDELRRMLIGFST